MFNYDLPVRDASIAQPLMPSGTGNASQLEVNMGRHPNSKRSQGPLNAACHALGLEWDVDATVRPGTGGLQSERDIVRSYIAAHQPHLLSCYDVEFLVDLVLAQKAQRGAAGGVAVESYTPL